MGQAPDELMYHEDQGLPPKNGGMPPDERESPSIPELRDEIAQTRAEMSGTLDTLEARLSPQALAEEAKAKVRSKAEEGFDRAKEALRENVQQPLEQGVALVSAQTQQLASDLPAYLSALREEAGRQSTRLFARMRQLQQQNPVAFAAVLAAVGAGLSVAGALLARAVNRTTDA